MRQRVIMDRANRRKQMKATIECAKLLDEFKAALAETNREDDSPENLNEAEKVIFNFYNSKWKNYCHKWNIRRGHPELDVNLFSKEANKYLNELRTVPESGPVEQVS